MRTACYVLVTIDRMCSLTTECVLLLWNVFSYYIGLACVLGEHLAAFYRMCSLTIECVLLLWNVFSYYIGLACVLGEHLAAF